MCEDYANNTYPQAPTKVVGVSTYSRVIIEGKLVGHAFGCRWTCKGGTVCWITQLVVDRHHRGKGFATSLLRILRTDHDTIYGVMSSHPAACLAAVKAFDSKSHTKSSGGVILILSRNYRKGRP